MELPTCLHCEKKPTANRSGLCKWCLDKLKPKGESFKTICERQLRNDPEHLSRYAVEQERIQMELATRGERLASCLSCRKEFFANRIMVDCHECRTKGRFGNRRKSRQIKRMKEKTENYLEILLRA